MGARPESTGRKTLLGPAALGAYSVEQFYVPQDELITLAAWKKEQAEAAQRVPKLTAADLARLDSWMTELAAQVQARGARRRAATGASAATMRSSFTRTASGTTSPAATVGMEH